MADVAIEPAVSTRRSLFRRPTAEHGVWSWLTTVDHKRIGILYFVTSFFFFLVGGLEALLIRSQLARPGGTVLTAEQYNQVFTMHGVTMIFLVVMPMSAAFFNYLLPIMIGARDVAFPRLNAFSYWVFLFGGLFLYSSFLLGGAPNGGWFGYAPLSTQAPLTHNMDFYALGLLVLGISSTVAAVNFIVTIINLRAPGMSLFRMPVFVWMTFVVQFLLVFALPVITIDLVELLVERRWGAQFFNAQAGGDPVLWQHLFWLFGHPEVYILILPAMGIVSEILPVFSRKPLFGYPVVVFSGIAIGIMGWGVWAHHMFAVGLGPVANTAFSLTTMFIAVPTGVKIFNWIGTMWGGDLRFKSPMLFAIGFIAMFIIGGLSGVTHAVVPSDYQQTDTYYIVAHFHYVLFGGSVFGLFAGMYYWWPKVTGRLLNDRVGKLHFWLMLIGFNVTFAPFHWLCLQGMPRRIYTYPSYGGWDFWNFVSTIGSFTIALSVALFLYNVVRSIRQPEYATDDPWDGRTLEWTIPSPPPHYNFAEIPVVHSVDDFWHRKYAEGEDGRLAPVVAGGSNGGGEEDVPVDPIGESTEGHEDHGHGIHMPSPSYYPLLSALGLPILSYGILYSPILVIDGALLLLAGLYGWALEPSAEPEPEPTLETGA
ncbi:MAG TPA: cytochrome c oxidase subunit I [Actinomycetota bacterium]|nr:cytochrome c oxidase subunit I [Actinomycetota bacterium]